MSVPESNRLEVVPTPAFIEYVMTNADQSLKDQAVMDAMELAQMLLGADSGEGLHFQLSATQAGNNHPASYVMIVCVVETGPAFTLPEGAPYVSVDEFVGELTLMLRDTGVEARNLKWRAVKVGNQILLHPPD